MIGGLWQKWLSWIASLGIGVMAAGKGKDKIDRMRRLDFGTSSQKMGVRFTERLRDHWRRHWLKIRK